MLNSVKQELHKCMPYDQCGWLPISVGKMNNRISFLFAELFDKLFAEARFFL